MNSGECFTCGFTGHLGAQTGEICQSLGHQPLHPNKQLWRVMCGHILKESRTTTNVHFIAIDDYGTTLQDIQGKQGGAVNISTSLTAPVIENEEERTNSVTEAKASDVSDVDSRIQIVDLYIMGYEETSPTIRASIKHQHRDWRRHTSLGQY